MFIEQLPLFFHSFIIYSIHDFFTKKTYLYFLICYILIDDSVNRINFMELRKGMEINMNNENQTTETLSHSKAKRLARQKEIAETKKKAKLGNLIYIFAIVGVLAIFGCGVYQMVMQQVNRIRPNDDYSAKLTDNGYIQNVKASDMVVLPEYKGITIPLSEVEFTDEQVEADIQSQLTRYQVLSEDTAKTAADGDQVNIDYTGSIDGVEFEGGSAQGANLTLGSGMFIDNFEEQLVGHNVGETVDVTVTFPENYSATDLAGKEALFVVKINGIYETGEFNDEFVATNLSTYASTVEEYKQYLKDKNLKQNTRSWIQNYLTTNTTVNSYPKSYVRQVKNLEKFTMLDTYEYMNEYYVNSTGSPMYNSFDEFVGMSEASYDASLQQTGEAQVKEDLLYQAIAEAEGIVLTAEDCLAYETENNGISEEYFNSRLETYGNGYIVKDYIKNFVIDLIAENAIVE